MTAFTVLLAATPNGLSAVTSPFGASFPPPSFPPPPGAAHEASVRPRGSATAEAIAPRSSVRRLTDELPRSMMCFLSCHALHRAMMCSFEWSSRLRAPPAGSAPRLPAAGDGHRRRREPRRDPLEIELGRQQIDEVDHH